MYCTRLEISFNWTIQKCLNTERKFRNGVKCNDRVPNTYKRFEFYFTQHEVITIKNTSKKKKRFEKKEIMKVKVVTHSTMCPLLSSMAFCERCCNLTHMPLKKTLLLDPSWPKCKPELRERDESFQLT